VRVSSWFRRTSTDAGLSALTVVGYELAAQGGLVAATPLDRPGSIAVTAAVIAISSLWWLRRASAEAFAVVAVVSTCLCTVTGALTSIALATIVLRGSWRRTVVATLVMTAAVFVVQLGVNPSPHPQRAAAGTVVLFVAVAGWARAVAHRRQVVELLREQVERSALEAAQQAEAARREERSRIARDVHDSLAHRMSLLAIQGAALAQRAGTAAGGLGELALAMRATARESLEDLRWVMGALYDEADEPLRPVPGPADLPALVEQARSLGEQITLDIEPGAADLESLSAPVGHVLYRIVQESLTNCRKHGPGAPVRVAVIVQPGRTVDVTVAENGSARGTGHDVIVPGSGRGLLGLSERVRTVGGNFEHGPGQGGYRVHAMLPWVPARTGAA
jgi:signal transduction histidine kinase